MYKKIPKLKIPFDKDGQIIMYKYSSFSRYPGMSWRDNGVFEATYSILYIDRNTSLRNMDDHHSYLMRADDLQKTLEAFGMQNGIFQGQFHFAVKWNKYYVVPYLKKS